MQETVFYPKYLLRHSSDVLSISLFLTLALLYSFLKVGPILSNIIGVCFLLFFVITFSRLYIRRIVFTSSYLIVEKYVWPSMKIDYSEVVDMGASKIKTRRGEISFAAMSNVTQLQSLFFDLLRQGKIDIEQFENKALNEEVALDRSFLPTVIVSAVLGAIFLLYWFFHQSDFTLWNILLVFSLMVMVIFTVVYWINKKRTKIH